MIILNHSQGQIYGIPHTKNEDMNSNKIYAISNSMKLRLILIRFLLAISNNYETLIL